MYAIILQNRVFTPLTLSYPYLKIQFIEAEIFGFEWRP